MNAAAIKAETIDRNAPLPGRTDGVSQAEMDYWKECASQAPAILRETHGALSAKPLPDPYLAATVAVGAIMTAASFLKGVKGIWKHGMRIGAASAIVAGYLASREIKQTNETGAAMVKVVEESFANYAYALEHKPELRDQFADYLSRNVTAADASSKQMDQIVAEKAMEFGQKYTKFFKIENLHQQTQNSLGHSGL